jgi:hypothetical protein
MNHCFQGTPYKRKIPSSLQGFPREFLFILSVKTVLQSRRSQV